MLRAYRPQRGRQRSTQCREVNTFIPALALQFSRNPAEIEVGHEERHAGESKYSLYQPGPPQLRPGDRLLAGAAAGVLAARDRAVDAVGAAVPDPARRAGSCWGLRKAASSPCSPCCSCWSGMALFGIGLLGEYIGRIYQEVRARPRYRIKAVLERKRPGRPSVFAYHNVGELACGCCTMRGVRRGAGRSPILTPPARPSGSPAWPIPPWRRRTSCAA